MHSNLGQGLTCISLQLNERLIERDPRWHCERWFQQSFLDGLVEIFFIDTNPFILRYHTEPWAINKGAPHTNILDKCSFISS